MLYDDKNVAEGSAMFHGDGKSAATSNSVLIMIFVSVR